MVPHHGTNWAALRLTAQIGRDAVLSESYGRGYLNTVPGVMSPLSPQPQTVPESGQFNVGTMETVSGRFRAPNLRP